jgi:hypothetical protein
MLTKKRVRRNSKRSKKFLLVGGADSVAKTDDIIKADIITRLKVFGEFYNDKEAEEKATEIIKVIPEGCPVSGEENIKPETELDPDNTIITYSPLHGCITGFREPNQSVENDSIYLNVVPNNTIICFLTYIDSLFSSIHDAENTSIHYYLQKLTSDNFNYIINKKQQIQFEDAPIDNLNKVPSPSTQIVNMRYNCFKNSMWYYPGDKYPNVAIAAKREDFEKPAEPECIHFSQPFDIQKNGKNIQVNSNDNFFEESEYMFNLKETFTITTKDTLKQESLQNSIIRMSNPGKVKIIIMGCCRAMININTDMTLQLLENELFYYHKNTTTHQTLTTTPGITVPNDCSGYTKYYYYWYYDITFQDFINTKRLDSHKKIYSYDGRTPSLQLIKNKTSLVEKDYAYLNILSITQLNLFFIEISKGKDAYRKIDNIKYKSHWKEFLKLCLKYSEFRTKLKAINDFFMSNIGLIILLNPKELNNDLGDLRNAVIQLLPIFKELYDEIGSDIYEIYHNLDFLYNVFDGMSKFPNNTETYKLIKDSKNPINTLDINSINSYTLSEMQYIPFKILNINGSEHFKFIQDTYNNTVNTINITNMNFIYNKDFSIQLFNKLVYLSIIYYGVSESTIPLVIKNNNLQFLYIYNNWGYLKNDEYKLHIHIHKIDINTPNLSILKFENVIFKSAYYFKLLFEFQYIHNLSKLTFIDCKAPSATFSPKYFKHMHTLDYLIIDECDFKFEETNYKNIVLSLVEAVSENINSIVFKLLDAKIYEGDDIMDGVDRYRYIRLSHEKKKIYKDLLAKQSYERK